MRMYFLWLTAIVAVFCVLVGCKGEEDKEEQTLLRTIEAVADQIRAYEENPKFVDSLPLCRDVLSRLERYGKSAVTTVPDPFRINVVERFKTGLVVRYVEEDTDILGIGVREYWPDGQAIWEVYELDKGSRSAMAPNRPAWSWVRGFVFLVTERTTPSLRKDGKQWEAWVEEGSPELQPQLYIARPSPKVHVLISLIDEQGHESRAVPLTCWLAYPDANDPIEGTKQ